MSKSANARSASGPLVGEPGIEHLHNARIAKRKLGLSAVEIPIAIAIEEFEIGPQLLRPARWRAARRQN